MMKHILSVVMFAFVMVAGVAHAEEATVESIDGDVVTLDNGDTITGSDNSQIHVGDEVEIDKTYTDPNGNEWEEY